MVLENKLSIKNQIELNKTEERISKQKAKELYDSGYIDKIEIGTFKGLATIHKYLFEDIYYFAGISLKNIDKMPQDTYEHIIEKYVEMNVAHPFREGNGRSMRIWLDLILKKEIKKVIDWNKIDKEEYLSAMERSVIKDTEIKELLKTGLTNKINDRLIFMKGIDISYYYEGYSSYSILE